MKMDEKISKLANSLPISNECLGAVSLITALVGICGIILDIIVRSPILFHINAIIFINYLIIGVIIREREIKKLKDDKTNPRSET